jgi:indolepyruvate ferredoxin oxidoreductase beta subunit
MNYDVVAVGVGGQGVLTMGDLIAHTALEMHMPVNLYPTKGMAQRGGSVKVEIRLGRQVAGPQIAERGADLVIGMERSESLKAVRYLKPNGHAILYGQVWAPTAVTLGQAPYPALQDVREQFRAAGANLLVLDPDRLPLHQDVPTPANLYVLGAAMALTPLGSILDPRRTADLVHQRWEAARPANDLAFQAGLNTVIGP